MKLEMTFDEFAAFLKQFGVNLDRVEHSAANCRETKVYLSSPFPKELVAPKTAKEQLIVLIPEIEPLLCPNHKIEAIKKYRDFKNSSLSEAKAAVEKAMDENA
jgi:hypothetical protein